MIRKPVPSRDELASLPYLLAFHDYSGIWLTAFREDDYDFNLPVACNSIVELYLSAKKPAKLPNSKSLTLDFSRRQIWPVFLPKPRMWRINGRIIRPTSTEDDTSI